MAAMLGGEELGLALEAVEPVAVALEFLSQGLDGHLPVEPRVARPIDLSHAAGTERREDLIVADAGAGGERHGESTLAQGWTGGTGPSPIDSRKILPPNLHRSVFVGACGHGAREWWREERGPVEGCYRFMARRDGENIDGYSPRFIAGEQVGPAVSIEADPMMGVAAVLEILAMPATVHPIAEDLDPSRLSDCEILSCGPEPNARMPHSVEGPVSGWIVVTEEPSTRHGFAVLASQSGESLVPNQRLASDRNAMLVHCQRQQAQFARGCPGVRNAGSVRGLRPRGRSRGLTRGGFDQRGAADQQQQKQRDPTRDMGAAPGSRRFDVCSP